MVKRAMAVPQKRDAAVRSAVESAVETKEWESAVEQLQRHHAVLQSKVGQGSKKEAGQTAKRRKKEEPAERTTKRPRIRCKFERNAKVRAYWEEDGVWHPETIRTRHQDGMYTVLWDKGGRMTRLLSTHVSASHRS